MPDGSMPLGIDGKPYEWPMRLTKPWLAEVWEPLPTKAPSPALAQPFCCYLCTVIFYLNPYHTREWHHLYRWGDGWHAEKPGRHLEEWGRVETVMNWHSAIEIGGQTFEMQSGSVIWRRRRWWMLHWARRRQAAA